MHFNRKCRFFSFTLRLFVCPQLQDQHGGPVRFLGGSEPSFVRQWSRLLTFDPLRLVGAPHVLQDAAVEVLGQLGGHGGVEVRFVPLQDAL